MKLFNILSLFFILTPLYASSEISNSADHPLQMPLDMPVNVEPNIIVTIDNSGSMDTERTPDGLSSYEFCVKSHICNVSFFNPEYDYKLPYKYTYGANGIEFELYENPYPKKYYNGYLKTNLSDINDYDLYYYKLDPNKVVGSKQCKDKPYNEAQCFEKRNIRTDYGEEGVKRYAIWYSFYRTRMLAVQSSANIAFSQLPSNIRFIWQDMTSCFLPARGKQSPNAIENCYIRSEYYNRSNYFEKFSGEHKYNFFNWLANLTAPGGTPLHLVIRRAGEYVSTKEAYIDIPEELQRRGKTSEEIEAMSYSDIRKFLYAEEVVEKYGEPKVHSCRANYHILLTDGGWTDSSVVGNYDGSSIQLGTLDGQGSGIPYTNNSPYGDSHSGTLADTAFYYWARKLVDLPSDLVPYYEEGGDFWNPKNNPATWQHMSNFMVAFGLSSTLVTDPNKNPNNYPVWDETKDRPTFENLDGKVWPPVYDTQGKIYDLWHAAINTRGEFFSVDRPDDLIIAFNRIIQRVGERQTYGTSPAISSGIVEAQDLSKSYSVSYQATFDSEEGWTGNIKATKTDEKGSSSALWAAGAKELLERSLSSEKDIDRRVVKTSITAGSGLNIKHKMIDFTWSEISDDYKYLLNINPDTNKDDKLGESRLQFIRGSNQLANGEIFRKREYRLGDIINSKPVVVHGASLLPFIMEGYTTGGASPSYTKFAADMKNRTPMLYVGSNDGMLHAFNANTGKEVFSYIPQAVIQNLNKLTSPKYGKKLHQYYVDATPVVSDVIINGSWRTVLVGTLGAGGKGVFALDITEPNNIKLLWDYTDKTLELKHTKLGYTYASPVIIPVHEFYDIWKIDGAQLTFDTTWGVVLGNGYDPDATHGRGSIIFVDYC